MTGTFSPSGNTTDAHASPRTGFSGAIASMRVPAYRNFTIANTISLIGTWLQRVATGWLTWQLTASPSWLGIISFADLFTLILISPLAGAVADRIDRRRLAVMAQVVLMAQAIAVAVFYLLGWMTIELLLGLTILLGIGNGIHTAARMSLMPSLVPKSLLAPAIGINAMTFNVARFIGPAAAGAVIVTWGVGPAFVINAFSFVPLMIVLWHLRVVVHENLAPDGNLFHQMGEGLRYALRHPGIGPMILAMGIVALSVRALPDMLPGFAAGVFGRGADGLAWLTSAMGCGAMVGALVLARTNDVQGLTRRLTRNVAFIALSILAFVSTHEFWIGVLCAVACGYVLTTNGATSQTLIQSAVDSTVRGRVMSTFTLIYQGAPALGGLLIGFAADHIGLRLPFTCGAILCLLAFAWLMHRGATIAPALEAGIEKDRTADTRP